MGKLYDARMKIEKTIQDKGLDIYKTKGQIGLKTGLIMDFLKPDTPDDDTKLEKLRAAAKEVLGIAI